MAAFGVLIVDDNWLFVEAARDRLEREGLRVVGVAATSAEALRRAEELRPEVVLVDIMLGGESGFELTDDPDPLHAYLRAASHTLPAAQIQPQLSESFRLADAHKTNGA
jgi:CheY-like chemotaxis protein